MLVSTTKPSEDSLLGWVYLTDFKQFLLYVMYFIGTVYIYFHGKNIFMETTIMGCFQSGRNGNSQSSGNREQKPFAKGEKHTTRVNGGNDIPVFVFSNWQIDA